MPQLAQLAPHLFEVNPPSKLLGHRMTIIRLPDSLGGGLWLHSPVEFTDDLWAELDALAPGNAARHLVIPSRTHDLHLEPWMERIPSIQTYAPPALMKAHPTWSIGNTLKPDSQASWSSQLPHICLMGAPRVSEVVFFDQASKTLILVDSVFAVSGQKPFLSRLFLRLNGCLEGIATSRLFRFMIKDKSAFRASVNLILTWDFERVVVGHGEVLEGSRVAELREHLASI